MIHLTKPADEAFNRVDYPDDALFFFDFDGVLAEQDEEKLFRLPEIPLERAELEARALLIGIDSTLYDTRYLRHLVYQALAFDNLCVLHEPARQFVCDLDDEGDPYFVVTARSGYYAVKRLIDTLDSQALMPQELFCLGRSSKAELLAKLRKDWPDQPFVYFEDSQHHIEATKALGDPDLTIVEVTWPACTVQAEALRKNTLGY